MPAKRLVAATIYTVTVRRGVAVAGTDEPLESDMQFRFETAAASSGNLRLLPVLRRTDRIVDGGPPDGRALGLPGLRRRGTRRPPKTARIEVHRLADLDAAIAAYRQVRASPSWSRASAAGLVPTGDLQTTLSTPGCMTRRTASGSSCPRSCLLAGTSSGPLGDAAGPGHPPGHRHRGLPVVTETPTLVWANDSSSGGTGRRGRRGDRRDRSRAHGRRRDADRGHAGGLKAGRAVHRDCSPV